MSRGYRSIFNRVPVSELVKAQRHQLLVAKLLSGFFTRHREAIETYNKLRSQYDDYTTRVATELAQVEREIQPLKIADRHGSRFVDVDGRTIDISIPPPATIQDGYGIALRHLSPVALRTAIIALQDALQGVK